MKVLFFAHCRQLAGCADYTLDSLYSLTQDEFWTLLIKTFPALASQQKTARLARRESYLSSGDLLHPGDEIAVLPPVSGG